MNHNDIQNFLSCRDYSLSQEEINQVIDTERNPQIDHIIYENDAWKVWDSKGNYYTFERKNYKCN